MAPAISPAGSQTLRPLSSRTLSIDIVLPVLNEAHVLEKSVAKLRAYLQQNLPYRYQIIIADNGSTDGTSQAAAKLAQQFADIK